MQSIAPYHSLKHDLDTVYCYIIIKAKTPIQPGMTVTLLVT